MPILRAFTALLLASIPVIALPADTAGRMTREYDLKAAFLFNFAQFVDWPAEAFPDAGSPMTICVLGEDPFGKSLDDILEDESVRNRQLVVRRHRTIEEVEACHILFISASQAGRMDWILARLDGRSILTVGETEDFAVHSGMIRFVVRANKVRLRINVEAAKAAKLTISSKLLRLAEVVTPEQGP